MKTRATVQVSLASSLSSKSRGMMPLFANNIPRTMNASNVGTPILDEMLFSQTQMRMIAEIRMRKNVVIYLLTAVPSRETHLIQEQCCPVLFKIGEFAGRYIVIILKII